MSDALGMPTTARAPAPEPVTTTCVVCGRALTWHCATPHCDPSAHDYCSSWCRQGHALLRRLHDELKIGAHMIRHAEERAQQAEQEAAHAGESLGPYYQDREIEAQIAENVRSLLLCAYDGIRRLDGLVFFDWSRKR